MNNLTLHEFLNKNKECISVKIPIIDSLSEDSEYVLARFSFIIFCEFHKLGLCPNTECLEKGKIAFSKDYQKFVDKDEEIKKYL